MSGDSKFFLGVVVVAILAIGGVVFLSKSGGPSTANVDVKDGWKTGSDSAPVKIVEFGDFQCPACQVAAVPLRDAVASRKDKVQLIYMHFPLVGAHKNAMSSALAAEAAGAQGKFWEMYDQLYATQSQWETSKADESGLFRQIAKELKLDMGKYDKTVSDRSVEKKINSQLAYGTSLGVDRTPTFFVNNKKYTGGRTVSQWQQLIDDEVAAAKKNASGSQSPTK